MKVGGKKKISCSFLDSPKKPSPYFFLTTPHKMENPFFQQLIKINQYNCHCTSSIYSAPVQKNFTEGKNCTTTYIHILHTTVHIYFQKRLPQDPYRI